MLWLSVRRQMYTGQLSNYKSDKFCHLSLFTGAWYLALSCNLAPNFSEVRRAQKDISTSIVCRRSCKLRRSAYYLMPGVFNFLCEVSCLRHTSDTSHHDIKTQTANVHSVFCLSENYWSHIDCCRWRGSMFWRPHSWCPADWKLQDLPSCSCKNWDSG